MARQMKDSGIEWIGEIPETWNVSKMKYIGDYVNGYAFKPEQWGDKGKRIIRIQDLTHSSENPNYFDGAIDSKYHVTTGDILVSWAATLDAFIWDREDGWLNQHIFKATPVYSQVCYDFFFWMIKESMQNMNNDNKHGIMMQHVTLNVFGDFSVPLPGISEQHRIADFLDRRCAEIDAVIERTKTTIEEYKKLKQAVITEAVTKGVRGERKMKDSGIEWIGEIPEEWSVPKFGYVAEVKSNLVAPELYPNHVQISPENIEKGSGRLLSYGTVADVGVISGNHLFYEGQILYSKIRPKLNKVCIAPCEGLCSADIYPIETYHVTRFVMYCMLSDVFLSQVAMVTEERVKMPKINQEELARIRVAMPDTVDEENEIVEYLDARCIALDTLISKKTALLTELETYKNSLIYEYVTGKKEA